MIVESLYVHFPFCRHLCNYCDFHKSIIEVDKVEQFQDRLVTQIRKNYELITQNGGSFSELKTIYIGGGTPSLWGGGGISFLIEELRKSSILITSDTEFTLELNPGAWDERSIHELIKLGVNRFSVGVQSLNQGILKKLDRIHTLEDVYKTLDLLKSLNVNYSVDFMLGLPGFQQRDLFQEIDEVMKYKPSHISSYILTVSKNYIHSGKLPGDDFIANEYLSFVNYLKKYEFSQYEVSNFSKKGKESKHNLQYWMSNSVAALGPSATGFLVKESSAMRYKWKTGERSEDYTIENLDFATVHFEKVYLALRCATDLNLLNYFLPENHKSIADICKSWKTKGFSSGDAESLSLTPKGFLVLDSLFSDLFRFLQN